MTEVNLSTAIGHNGGPSLASGPPPWLIDRHAVISARPRARGAPRWVVRFERKKPPFLEQLMGWTGGDDPLASEVELTFLSKEAAIDYCERNGLEYRLAAPGRTPKRAGVERRSRGGEARDEAGAPAWLANLNAVYGRCELSGLPDVERALIAPASVFAEPAEVVRHPLLTYDCKREILARWAHDEFLKELAEGEGMCGGEPSRLDEVKAALIALGEPRRPSPAAPAMFIVAAPEEPALVMAMRPQRPLALAA